MDSNITLPFKEEANELLNDLLNHSKTKNKTQVRQLFIGNLPFRVRWQDIKDQFRKAGNVVRADVALTFDNRSKGHGTVLFTTIEDAQKAIDMFDNFKWLGRFIEVRGDRGFIDTDSKKSVTPLPKPESPLIQKLSTKHMTPKQVITSHISTAQPSIKHQAKHLPPKEVTHNKSSPKQLSQNQSPSRNPSQDKLASKDPSQEQLSPKQPFQEQLSPKQPSQDKVSPKQLPINQPSPKIESLPIESKEEEYVDDENCKQLFVGNLPFQCQWQDLKNLFKSSGRILRADVVLNFEGRSRGFGTVLFTNHKDAKQAIEQYNGFEFHNRILRVHFDKFAASHQRFREHEESTFGQRHIHDPESIELLRQTYSYTSTQYTTPYQPVRELDMNQGMMQMQPSFGYYPLQNNIMYGYNNQQWVQPPLAQYQTGNDELTSLSTSLDNIAIYNTPRNGESAGLMDSNTKWY